MPNKDVLNTRQTWLEKPCLSLFGVWLRQQRYKKAMSQKDFAFEAGIPRSIYSDYERGRHHPGENHAHRLATFLEVTFEYVVQKARESVEYWQEQGEDGVQKLIERQPKRPTLRAAINSAYLNEGTDKAYKNLRDDKEPTVYQKVTLPQSFVKRLELAACQIDNGTTVSSLLGEKIVELMNAGWPETH